MNLAPVAIFVYNRPEHTKKMLDSLKENHLAVETEIYIFIDGIKTKDHYYRNEKVKEICNSIVGFKRIHIIERVINFGLAKNIVDGVDFVINKHGKIIVLEDDIVTSRFFLNFMNDALDLYENIQDVWHISGWTYPDLKSSEQVFLWRLMNCWGWATWIDRWQHFEKNPKKIIEEWTNKEISKFNLDGCENFFRQIKLNSTKKINTWAVFWYATIFKNNGLCLNPVNSFVKNIGIDGSGEHCTNNDIYTAEINQEYESIKLLTIEENSLIVEQIKRFYLQNKPSMFNRILNKIKKIYKS